MNGSMRDPEQDYEALRSMFDAPLRKIARSAVKVWFNQQRLDQVLSEHLPECPCCDLLYALNTRGQQVSSNVFLTSIDSSAYHQDLSQRPYSVTLSVISNAAYGDAFLCDTYISSITRRPCVTIMYGVTSGPDTLGFIAADLDLRNLPVT